MNRVAIIGPSGAGKSTLARRLGPILDLPVIHLDTEYWQPGWVEPPKPWWAARIRELVRRDRWIIDGNFGDTMSARLVRADTIIFLDFSRLRCLWGVIKRVLKYGGRTRPDLPPGCPEQWDWTFIEFVWNFPTESRPKVLRRLRELDETKRVIWLRDHDEVERFVAALRAESLARRIDDPG